MDSAARLAHDINERLRRLTYQFAEDDEKQTLSIDSYPATYYSLTAGGTVRGTSAEWMRAKHRGGRIHEPGMIAALEALHDGTDSIATVFDIGALYGYYSVICLAMFESAQVHAFEMNPIAYAAMEENLALNAHLDVSRFSGWNCALSDVSERGRKVRIRNRALVTPETPLSMRIRNLALGPVKQMLKGKLGGTFEPFSIDFWSIDDFCDEKQASPDLIKIDVEGFQARIVPGGLKTFAERKPFVLLEFDEPGEVNSQGVSNQAVATILFDLGYRLVWGDHRERDGTFSPLTLSEWGEVHESNSLGLFFHEERLASG
jgi:FkbM family methyltransferase